MIGGGQFGGPPGGPGSGTWLPPQALERLQQQAARPQAWTSDLSVNELAAIRSVGFEPAGQVMGSCVYQLGWGSNWGCRGYGFQAWPMTAYENALTASRRLALDRMQQEARLLGSVGVAGVRINLRYFESRQNLIEFTAIGTALRRVGQAPLPNPFLSQLSGQQLAKLLHTGHVPCGLAMGVSCLYVHTGWRAGMQIQSWANTEITDFSRAVSESRVRAVHKLKADLAEFRADGAVGSSVNFNVWRSACAAGGEDAPEDHIVQFFAMGTAVTRFETPEPMKPPSMVMRLDDLKKRSAVFE